MIDGTKLLSTIDKIALEKQIDYQIILDSIKDGIKKAYEKYFDHKITINVNIDLQTGQITVTKELLIVKKVENDLLEIELNEAEKKYGENIKIGDVIQEPVNSNIFSRLAIIQIGQIIKQQIKEAEKNSIFKEYISQKGNIMYGIVIAVEEKYLLVEIGRTFAYIPHKNLIFSDNYDVGEYITFLAEDVNKSKNIGQITGTRISNEFLLKLLEREIPEIFEAIIEVKTIARDPGKRSKIAVYSHNKNVDPIGTCIGTKGNRINKVTEELNNEKIDICIYSPDIKEFIINSLSPVKVISIMTHDKNTEADVIVPDEQLSLAIGKGGNTVKLVAKLTKWKLNIISYSDALANNVKIVWNGNLTFKSLDELKVKLKDRIKNKIPMIQKNQITKEGHENYLKIYEEHLIETEKYENNNGNYKIKNLSTYNNDILSKDVNLKEDLKIIENNLSFFENKDDNQKQDEEIN